jgi:hypothetical protein
MLLLAPPSRRAHDVAISLRAPAGDPAIADLVAAEAMGASCPEKVALRVRACILHSGRYDCRVSYQVVIPCVLENMRAILAGFGASIIVMDETGEPVPHDARSDGTTGGGAMRWLHAPRRTTPRPQGADRRPRP